MKKTRNKSSNKSRIVQLMKESSKPQCIHRIAKKLGLLEQSVSSCVFFLAKNHTVKKSKNTRTCRWSAYPHSFYTYSGKSRNIVVKPSNPNPQSKNILDVKISKIRNPTDDKIITLTNKLSRESLKVELLKEMLKEELVS